MDGAGGEKLDPACVLPRRRRRGAGWFSVRAATCAVRGVNGTPGLHPRSQCPLPPTVSSVPGGTPSPRAGEAQVSAAD